jgi:copper chaperone CopZ
MLLSFMLFAVSCGGGKNQKAAETPAQTATIDLAIEGMTCTGCENTICSNLEKLPGVKSVTASHTGGNAIIEFEPGKVDTLKIKETVDGLGYRALKASAVEPGGSE